MNRPHCLYALLMVWVVALTSCNKTESAAPPQEYYGVKVDWPKLDSEFTNTSPDVEAKVSLVKRAFRYGQFPQALAPLDALANNPNLTDSQKKLVHDLVEQTKQVIAKMPPPPKP